MLKQFARHDEEANGACLSLEQLIGYVESILSPEEKNKRR